MFGVSPNITLNARLWEQTLTTIPLWESGQMTTFPQRDRGQSRVFPLRVPSYYNGLQMVQLVVGDVAIWWLGITWVYLLWRWSS